MAAVEHAQPFPFLSLSVIGGVVLPLYNSAAAADAPTSDPVTADRRRWLRYWAVVASLAAAERALVTRGGGGRPPPPYSHARALTLLYLASSSWRGADRVYVTALEPALVAVAPWVEAVRRDAAALAASLPGAAAVADSLTRGLGRVPGLGWAFGGKPPRELRAKEGSAWARKVKRG